MEKNVEEGRAHSKTKSHGIFKHPRRDTRAQKYHYSTSHSGKEFYTSKEQMSILKVSRFKPQRRRHVQDNLQRELRNINPPTLDGEKKMKNMWKPGC
jgi:hypothetical protein